MDAAQVPPPSSIQAPDNVAPASRSTLSADDLQKAWERLQKTPWKSTFCAGQRWFETYTLIQKDRVRVQLIEFIDGIQNLPFGQVNTLLVVTGFGAMREGARIASSILGAAPQTDSPDTVPFEHFWSISLEIMDPTSKAHLALCGLLEEHPEVDALMENMARELTNTLCTKVPTLEKDREFLERITLMGVFQGVQLEFFLPKLINNAEAYLPSA